MSKLEALGHPCVCLQQPSFNISSEQFKNVTTYDDAQAIRELLDKLIIEQQRQVMLVLHSYGGVVGTEAADASLSLVHRRSQGLPGGITRLVFMCASYCRAAQV